MLYWCATVPHLVVGSSRVLRADAALGVCTEPTTGVVYKVEDSAELFLAIESVWNDENYWVNMQDKSFKINVAPAACRCATTAPSLLSTA